MRSFLEPADMLAQLPFRGSSKIIVLICLQKQNYLVKDIKFCQMLFSSQITTLRKQNSGSLRRYIGSF